MSGNASRRYPQELRERAVRMVGEIRADHESEWAAVNKVAELLGLASQDAIDLLKKETGIDVKSASSSIEEIVARQFVERQARKRNITLPHGHMFADHAAAKKPTGKSAKAPEPPKPAE